MLRWFRFEGWLPALLIYLTLGVAVWWHAWSGGPSVSVPAGSLDPGQEVWFLAWALHALEHGDNPFFTHALYAPQGVNMLANTSILAVGLLLAPVTALFGPIVSFNVAVTLAPVASALAAFFAIRRYAAWGPAALVGGLCYGFGPFLAVDLRYGHLNLTLLAIPPLMLLTLDELVVRRRRPPVALGAILGVLVVVQFFVSTEMLLLTVVVGFVGLVVLALSHPRKVAEAARSTTAGLVVGVGIATAALAYPAWFALAGPRHVAGPVFPNLDNLSSTLAASILAHGERPGVAFVSGGNGAYLGVPLVLLLIVAGWILRRDASLRFAVLMAAIVYVLSLGAALHVTQSDTGLPLPAAVFQHLPLFDSIVASRFGAFADLFAGMGLAIVLDRLHAGDFGTSANLVRNRHGESQSRSRNLWIGGACGLIIVATLAPLALLPPWPYAVLHLAEPRIFSERPLATLSETSIVREYPPVLVDDDPLVWQAEAGITYELSDGYAIVPGPGGHATEQPRLDSVALVFAAGVLGTLKVPVAASTDEAIRRAVAQERLKALVVTLGETGSAGIAAVLRSAFGPPTRRSGGALVWLLS